MRRWTLMAATVVAASAGALSAQTFSPADNPYRGEFAYEAGRELRPAVEVEGVRWHTLRVTPKDPERVRSGHQATTFIVFGLENMGEDGATAVVVLLFEDGHGNRLGQLRCDPQEVPSGEGMRSYQWKTKVQGDVLLAAEKLYLFLEVQR